MAEKNLDFDTVVDRRNTYSLKYDFAAKRNMPEDTALIFRILKKK